MGSLACLIAVAVASSVGAGDTPRPLEVTVQDDAQLLHGGPAHVDGTARRLAELGADRVRLTAGWSEIAPRPRSARRPAFDARDPAAYPANAWTALDRAVVAARRHGLDVMIDVAFWAPRWAVRRRAGTARRQRWAPSPAEYGQFAEAVARRYDGRFPDPADPRAALPAVRLWTTWNEPNHPSFLLPQWRRTRAGWRPASPHVYRRLHEQGHAAITRASADNRVLLGGLAATGDPGRGERRRVAPLRFLRELACVDGQLRPLRVPECRGYRPLRADGLAHHPYSFPLAPGVPSRDPDAARLADLDRVSALLRALAARGRIAGELPLYLTEYGYETAPPDALRGVSPEQQARHHGQATFLAWRRDDTRMFAQFLLRDLGPDARAREGTPARWRTWQTGLEYEDGRPKPALQAFRMPFWVEPRTVAGQPVVVAFGQVRPGRGPQRVAIEVLGADGAWRAISSLDARARGDRACDTDAGEFLTDADGFYLRALPYQGPLSYRARWTRPDGAVEQSVPLAPDPDALPAR